MGKCANENTEEKYCVSFALIDISYRRIDSCLNSFNELLLCAFNVLVLKKSKKIHIDSFFGSKGYYVY